MANPNLKAGPGRPKGLKNKWTTDVKAMILGALDKKGGQEWLEEQMEKNPVAFMTLLGKVIPSEVKADVTATVQNITRKIVDARNADD